MSEPVFSQSEAQAEAARQLAAQADAAPPVDAGASLEQMQSAAREVLLPMEQRINDLMASFAASQEQQAKVVADLQSQLASAKASAGPPAVELYANGVAALLKAHADANPDLGPGVFAEPLLVADQLKAAATEAVTSRNATQVSELAGVIQGWAARFRGKHLDFSGLLADLELLDEAAARLAA